MTCVAFRMLLGSRSRMVYLDAAKDSLSILPIATLALGMSNNAVGPYVQKAIPDFYLGRYKAMFVNRKSAAQLFDQHQTTNPRTREVCAKVSQFLTTLDMRKSQPEVRIALVPSPTRKRKRTASETIDVISHDERWNWTFGDQRFFGECELCQREITPLAAFPIAGQPVGFGCTMCRDTHADKLITYNRRSKKRMLVWLKGFGARSTGLCFGGCEGTLVFTGGWDQAHVLAACEGGKNDPENLRPMCNRCNLRQGTRHLCDFLRTERPRMSSISPEVLSFDSARMVYDMLIRGHAVKRLIKHI